MSYYPPSDSGVFGQRMEEAFELIEMEMRRAAAYFNDAIVFNDALVQPFREESIAVTRAMAVTPRNSADRFEACGRHAGAPAWQSSSPASAQRKASNS